MAREETDRENLLREATALVDRAELRLADEPLPVTVGFRRDGSLSIFFGAEAVYQFNAAGQLRRAFVDGLLYKAERGQLVALCRQRTASHVALVRTELDDAQRAVFLQAALGRLQRLQASLAGGQFEVLGEVANQPGVPDRARRWLAGRSGSIEVAARPHVS